MVNLKRLYFCLLLILDLLVIFFSIGISICSLLLLEQDVCVDHLLYKWAEIKKFSSLSTPFCDQGLTLTLLLVSAMERYSLTVTFYWSQAYVPGHWRLGCSGIRITFFFFFFWIIVYAFRVLPST